MHRLSIMEHRRSHLQEPRNAGSRLRCRFQHPVNLPLDLAPDEFLQLRCLVVFGMPRDHLVGDPAGSCEIPPFQVVLGQGLEMSMLFGSSSTARLKATSACWSLRRKS